MLLGGLLIILDFFDEKYPARKPEDSMSYYFESDAQQFDIDFEVVNVVRNFFPHMGLPLREGLSVMYRTLHGDWYNIGNYALDTPFSVDMSQFVSEGEVYEIMIYGPIISNLIKLQINLPDDSNSKILRWIPDKNVVVVGGPNSYGIGCTASEAMFSNIIERKFDANVYHVTYDEKNYLKTVKDFYDDAPPIGDIGIIELDYFSQNESVVEEHLVEVINLMKSKCKHIIGWYTIPEGRAYKKIILNRTIKEFVDNKEIEVLDLSYMYDDDFKDMCVYNVWFINDSANILIYKELKEVIRRLTQWNI